MSQVVRIEIMVTLQPSEAFSSPQSRVTVQGRRCFQPRSNTNLKANTCPQSPVFATTPSSGSRHRSYFSSCFGTLIFT